MNVYACGKCNKSFERLDEYTNHRLECAKNKDAANSSLHMLGLIEDAKEKETREKILAFEKKLDENFRKGRF
jgi:hypothetical protein